VWFGGFVKGDQHECTDAPVQDMRFQVSLLTYADIDSDNANCGIFHNV